MYISYSGYKTFNDCPLEYWHKYVGKTRPPKPDNRVNALYGTVVGKIFERFYNDFIWKRADRARQELLASVYPTIEEIVAEESKKGIYVWSDSKSNYPCVEAVAEDVRIAVRNGLEIIKMYRLLGPKAEAEVKLDFKQGDTIIGGRADFIIQRCDPHNDLTLLDGKGSKHREKYVDGAQLRWYALLYLLNYGKTPDKLGFVYWRSPPSDALDFVDFTVPGLRMLETQILKTMATIAEGIRVLEGRAPVEGRGPFQPLPEPSRCRFCTYRPLCQKKIMSAPPIGVEDVSLES